MIVDKMHNEIDEMSSVIMVIKSCLSIFVDISSVIVSVMTFEGENCRLAEVGTLADHTGGRVSHCYCSSAVHLHSVEQSGSCCRYQIRW